MPAAPHLLGETDPGAGPKPTEAVSSTAKFAWAFRNGLRGGVNPVGLLLLSRFHPKSHDRRGCHRNLSGAVFQTGRRRREAYRSRVLRHGADAARVVAGADVVRPCIEPTAHQFVLAAVSSENTNEAGLDALNHGRKMEQAIVPQTAGDVTPFRLPPRGARA